MSASTEDQPSAVAIRPEVVFLYELLDQLTSGQLRIPRFQRPFVWRLEQMTDLLDSIYNQYPIGSLLIWETDQSVATLDSLGPLVFPNIGEGSVGYLLDGHQRLATLAAALIPRDRQASKDTDSQPEALRWNMAWNMEVRRFQHGMAALQPNVLFPLSSLLDTLRFLDAVGNFRTSLEGQSEVIDRYTDEVRRLARSFQSYRVPVIRIRQTGLSEAVEIFARLNSRGQAMTADQMVSALMYRQGRKAESFDLASEIDTIEERLAEDSFSDIDRTTILRGVLANIDEDIYRTDWTRLASERREHLLQKLREGVERTSASFGHAVAFLSDCGVNTSRLLPYSIQFVLLSSFFDKNPAPSEDLLYFLRRWFWASSFSTWFGGANTARVSALVTEFREIAAEGKSPAELVNFEMDALALPFPKSFDMRSARTRTLLLVMVSLKPLHPDGELIAEPWREISEKGPGGVGHIFREPGSSRAGNPANRMIRPPGAAKGLLYSWIDRTFANADDKVLGSHGLTRRLLYDLHEGNVEEFIAGRQQLLSEHEYRFQRSVGVVSEQSVGGDSSEIK